MKILISNKFLLKELNEINFDDDYIVQAEVGENLLTLRSMDKDFEIECESMGVINCSQNNVRWDWVRDIMEQTHEQPVCLDIDHNKVDIIFSY